MILRLANWASALIILLWLVPTACLERIEPHRIGVRRSLEGGVAEQDFRVGYHLSVPFWHSWYQLDGTLHYLEFTHEENTALDVRTKENNIIFIDTTIPYRIKDGEGWRIVREGFADSYPDKVKSAAIGILRKELAELSNLDVQSPEKRRAVARTMLPILNESLAQYHMEATHVVLRAINFRAQYEEQLQNKQFYIVQGRLDQALKNQSEAQQTTDTMEKVTHKDIALKEEEWNRKIEELRSKYEIEIAGIEAEAQKYKRQREADADALYARLEAEGNLAEAMAEALGERLKAEALSSRAGRTFSAIEAAQNFKMGEVLLNSSDSGFLLRFGGMGAWRRFFLGE